MLKAYCIFNDFNKKAYEILKNVGVDLEISKKCNRPDKTELIELLKKFDILIIGAKEKITKDMLNGIKEKRIIATLSVGLDHIEEELFNSTRIKIINCPKSNVISVAEHIFSLILALNKRIIEANDISYTIGDKLGLSQKSEEISNKTLGVIGAGNISKEVIKIANAFNMKICCNTLHPEKHVDLKKYNVEFLDLNELLSTSDIITVNIPLNKQNRNLISKEKISLMKKTATFINTSRAEIVDVDELIKYANENQTFKVGLDIDVDKYKKVLNQKMNNVIITPHIAGVTKEAINRMDIELANNIKDYLNLNNQ